MSLDDEESVVTEELTSDDLTEELVDPIESSDEDDDYLNAIGESEDDESSSEDTDEEEDEIVSTSSSTKKPPVNKPKIQPLTGTELTILSSTIDTVVQPKKVTNRNVNKILGISDKPTKVTGAGNLDDLLVRETAESRDQFEYRIALTKRIATIPDYKLDNIASVTLGQMIMKKSYIGVRYSDEVENAITYILNLLQR